MNKLEKDLKIAIKEAVLNNYSLNIEHEDIVIEIPKDTSHGDYATNTAMRICKQVSDNPRNVALKIVEDIVKNNEFISDASVAGPGFINFKIASTAMSNIIKQVLIEGKDYGNNDEGKNKKVLVEYVSANPTGDLHLGHARGAAWGDSVTRIMKKAGYDVCREFYVNDAGNQINNLGLSLISRYNELFGIEIKMPEDGYFGEDVKNIALIMKDLYKDKYVNDLSDDTQLFFKKEGIKYELEKLKKDLENFRVDFDVWTSEQSLHDDNKVEQALEELSKLNQTYEKDGAIWFNSMKYGDDKDRVLKKSDGSYTYLVPDIAYHISKLKRGYTKLINFWGADHHGYIPRIKAALQALGYDKDALEVDIIQMVRLVKDKQEVKMSKRTGNAITVRELCEEVGIDAARYFFVQRAVDTHFDFDIGLAKSQSNDNPVFYAQYAHARICSILNQCSEYEDATNYDLITHEKEVVLLKYINEFTNVVIEAANTRAPHKICNYIQKLAASFHSFYGACKVNDLDNKVLSSQRIALLKATKITLSNALDLIGVEAIDRM